MRSGPDAGQKRGVENNVTRGRVGLPELTCLPFLFLMRAYRPQVLLSPRT